MQSILVFAGTYDDFIENGLKYQYDTGALIYIGGSMYLHSSDGNLYVMTTSEYNDFFRGLVDEPPEHSSLDEVQ